MGRVDTAPGRRRYWNHLHRTRVPVGWPDRRTRLAAEWNAGQLAVFDPPSEREWRGRLPGPSLQAYAVYVDERDQVGHDFAANTLVRFDPATEIFTPYQLPGPASNVRQILGRPGEVWGAASALDQLVVLRSS